MPTSVRYLNVPGFPGYRVGDDGTVWSAWRSCRSGSRISDTWKKMKPSVQRRTPGRSYCYLNLSRNGQSHTRTVHSLVLITFVGPCPTGMECRHLDGDPLNNKLTNLAWGTPEQNRRDNHANGAYQVGQDHSQAKLTDSQVIDIRTSYAAGGVLLRELAARHGVGVALVSMIVNRKIWRHLP